ncbi:putative aldouronate transport system permease protein [Paenibacillus sp. yr247]|uniref:ABC transporter permease n=1 Tax=Paenibacillus sp. yr247 TaxID=1761880 RepID=UPI00088A838B|nr:ABC transporter permease subunit [Paenibacillus sp. yr247]SDO37615.1 putative aldouronate transport system permease protein [Paenibacillus sp. yr247]
MIKKIQANHRLAVFLIALPGILHFLIFKYIPLLGNIIAFENYDLFKGMIHSSWVGFEHFEKMFTYAEFFHILQNTLVLALYSIIFGFPAPLLLSLLLNEIRLIWFKKQVQTFLYLPHFLSWIIVGGIFLNLLGIEGMVNNFMDWFGLSHIDFITQVDYFRGILVSLGIWKDVGWGMIIYLAAIAGINPSLYEAAVVDGASRWRQIWHITLPSLMPAIVVLFLLRIGHLLDSNVEQVLVFLNPLVRDVGEVIDTYVYRIGLLGAQFSYSTAIGLFKSIIGFFLIVGLNNLSKKLTGDSIY